VSNITLLRQSITFDELQSGVLDGLIAAETVIVLLFDEYRVRKHFCHHAERLGA
jgi:hypothetical protein